MSDPTIELLRKLDPTAGDDPARSVDAGSRTEMLGRIMATDATTTGAREDSVRSTGAGPRRLLVRRVLPGLVTAGLLAGITVSVVGLPGGSRQEALGPALSFAAEGNFLRVRIVDPQADAARYNAELKKHHLDVTLELKAASPSLVGVELGGAFGAGGKGITATAEPEGCQTGFTSPCVPTFLIPKDYRGSAALLVGRAPAAGEKITAHGQLDGPGEVLEGVKYQGMTVAEVKAILVKRGYSVPQYRVLKGKPAAAPEPKTTTPAPPVLGKPNVYLKTVPSNWLVWEALPLEGKEVFLDVSAKR